MTALQPIQATRTVPSDYRHFKKIGSEEVHTIEAYERTVSGTPYNDPQRQFSTNTYTERRTYGRDENGDIVVKIEKDPKEPVRPVSPVRPVTGDFRDDNLLKPLPHIDTSPLHIPRVEANKKRSSASHSPRSYSSYNEQISPRSLVSLGHSPRSGRSSGISVSPRVSLRPQSPSQTNVPMKMIIKKSRLVSIHDGRPVSPFVETVTYEPVVPLPASRIRILDDEYAEETGRRLESRRSIPRHLPRERDSIRSLHWEEMEQVPYQRTPGLRRDYDRYDHDQIRPRGDRLPVEHRHQNGHGLGRQRFSERTDYAGRDRVRNRVRSVDVHRSHSDPSGRRPRRDLSETPRRERLRRVEEAAVIIENPLYRAEY